MGEQADYRPPRRQGENERDPLLALEVALSAAPQPPSRVSEPGSDGARADQPDHDGAGAGQHEGWADRSAANRQGSSWPAVVATTVRLWLRRHGAALGRLVRRHRAITLAVLAVTLLVASGLIAAFLRHTGPAADAGRQAPHADTFAGAVGQNSGAAAGHAAAVWVARQVGRDAMVACDPGTCRVLRAQGFPAGNLLVLRSRATGLRFCNVIMATQAVRDLLGARLLSQNAPAVIAGFGSGAARIDVRAVAPEGAVAYRTALAADWDARRKAAAELVKSPRIHAGSAARQELLTGNVDSRLLITLAALAASHPVNVVAFGDVAPGASAGVPIREMEVSGAAGPAQSAVELQRMRSFVLAQHAVFLPAHVSLVRLAGGAAALRIEFGAPSPLGLLAGRPVNQ